MREIKFRAWNKEHKFLEDSPDTFKGKPLNYGIKLLEQEWKVMQFTGLKDKNGKEIYESDLILYEDEGSIMSSGEYEVMWDEENAGWGLGEEGDCSSICAGEVMALSEVIGFSTL